MLRRGARAALPSEAQALNPKTWPDDNKYIILILLKLNTDMCIIAVGFLSGYRRAPNSRGSHTKTTIIAQTRMGKFESIYACKSERPRVHGECDRSWKFKGRVYVECGEFPELPYKAWGSPRSDNVAIKRQPCMYYACEIKTACRRIRATE